MSRKGYGQWPKEQIKEAKALLAGGATLKSVAERYGVSTHTCRCKIDPQYAAIRRVSHHHGSYVQAGPPTEDIAARLAEIPRDTRDLTARLAGDPIFERSALYRRQHSDRET